MQDLELSPSARGRQCPRYGIGVHVGAIPTRAGPTRTPRNTRAWPQSYPCVRRAGFADPTPDIKMQELSPHARGRPGQECGRRCGLETTPVYAGPTTSPRSATPACRSYPCVREADNELLGIPTGFREYPRMRGADTRERSWRVNHQELSPHAQGRHRQDADAALRPRAMPARTQPTISSVASTMTPYGLSPGAGPTRGLGRSRRSRRTYPRMARGRRRRAVPPAHQSGAIPACAGPTSPWRLSLSHTWSYPHVREADTPEQLELSPQARGRHPPGVLVDMEPGAIPACAGPTR
jgi:hypothetical protein